MTLLFRLAPYLAIAAALVAGWLYVRGLQDMAAQVPILRAEIAAEKQARERDVAALTSLSSGLAKAATNTKRDTQIMTETIGATPTPSSPALRAFLDGLRAADREHVATSSLGH